MPGYNRRPTSPRRSNSGSVWAVHPIRGKNGSVVHRCGSIFDSLNDPMAVTKAENANGTAELQAELADQERARRGAQ